MGVPNGQGASGSPLDELDENDLPAGWTLSTAKPTHVALYHRPTGRSLASFPTPTGPGWTVMGVANYGGGAVFARGVWENKAATLLLEEAAAGNGGDWTDDPDTVASAPAPAPARDGDGIWNDDDEDDGDAEPDTDDDQQSGQSTLGEWSG